MKFQRIGYQISLTLLIRAAAFLVSISVSRADLIYVSYGDRTGYSRPDTIEKFDSVTHADLGVFAKTGLSLPQGLALDRAGNLYVANYGNNTIEKFTPEGVGSLFANTGSGPESLCFDNAGNLYVANYWASTIQKFTLDGAGSIFASTGLNYPTGLTIDSAGNLYAANGGNRTIERFTPGGVGSLFANTGLYSAPLGGLACDSKGNIYLGCMGTSESEIQKFTPDGVGSMFADNGGGGGTGLAFDSTGSLYAANYANNTIVGFTPSGAVSGFVNTINSPWGIAIQPVPEPFILTLIALGTSTLSLYRRR